MFFRSLIYLTGNSYTANQVLVMERVLLKKHGFVSYAPEPMLFLNRCLLAQGSLTHTAVPQVRLLQVRPRRLQGG